MTDQDLNPCNAPGYIKDVNIDGPPAYCSNDQTISQKAVSTRDLSFLLEKTSQKKTGFGQHALCDPMITGHTRNDQGKMGGGDGRGGELGIDNSNVVYRNAQAIRGCDEAVQDMFSDITVTDEFNNAHAVPIIWGTQEKAVAMLLQENVRKDNSLVVDRIRLPMLAIHTKDIQFNPKRYIYHKAVDYMRDLRSDGAPGFTVKERYGRDTVFGVTRGIPLDISYTLYAWALYRGDINEIVQQIIPKISPMGYIRVQGVSLEIGVKMDSMGNNITVNPNDGEPNVFKWQFEMTAESYLPQPIIRKKAVLKTKTELVDSLDDNTVASVLIRLEEAVKELQ